MEDAPKAAILAILIAVGLWLATATIGEWQVSKKHARHWRAHPINGEAVALAPFLVRASINGGQVKAHYLWVCGLSIRLTPDPQWVLLKTFTPFAARR